MSSRRALLLLVGAVDVVGDCDGEESPGDDVAAVAVSSARFCPSTSVAVALIASDCTAAGCRFVSFATTSPILITSSELQYPVPKHDFTLPNPTSVLLQSFKPQNATPSFTSAPSGLMIAL